MAEFLQILGVIILSIALKQCDHPLLRKLGSLAVLLGSFLIGYYITSHWETGLLCALSWFFLPWLELLTRVRKLRLARAHRLNRRFPPPRDQFPALPEITSELEEAGFHLIADTGWEWDGHTQFIRLMAKEDEALAVSINLVEQDSFFFYYLAFTSRHHDGTLWTSWDYPFAYSMKPAPEIRLNRSRGDGTTGGLLAAHRAFLKDNSIGKDQLQPVNPETLEETLQHDIEAQITHNLNIGVFLPVDAETIRYSWRGLLFIWLQFLRELVRLS